MDEIKAAVNELIIYFINLISQCTTLFKHVVAMVGGSSNAESSKPDLEDDDEEIDFTAQAERLLPEYDGPRANGDLASFTMRDVPVLLTEIPSESNLAVRRILKCNPRDLYGIIGVPWGSSEEVIKRHYRRQTLRVHPDKTDVAKAAIAFSKLSQAYEILSDKVSRGRLWWSAALKPTSRCV